MRKTVQFISVVLLVFALLTGCSIPQLKTEFTAPSWDTKISLPVGKATVNLSDFVDVENNELLVIDPETHVYTLQSSGDLDDTTFTMPSFELGDDILDMSIGEVFNQGAIEVSTGMTPLSDLTIDFDLGADNIVPAETRTLDTSDGGQYFSSTLFDTARLSNLASNKITFDLQTNEPIDTLTVTLMNGNTDLPVGEPAVWENVGNNPGGVTLGSIQSFPNEISLAGLTIPNSMYLVVEAEVHSTQGYIEIDTAISNSMEIVEISGFDPGSIGLDLPSIDIPPMTPLSGYDGDISVELASGKININVDSTQADPDDTYPFDIDFQLTLTEGGGDPEVLPIETDGEGNKYIDLTGVTISKDTTISGSASPSFANPLVYDVWRDATDEIVNYTYAINIGLSNLEAERISGNISEIVPDPNPDTPEWDVSISDQEAVFEEVDYPEGFPDNLPNFTSITASLDYENDTSLEGGFTVTLAGYEDENKNVAVLDDKGNPLTLEISLAIGARSSGTASLSNLDKLIPFLNYQPPFVEVTYSGGLSPIDNFEITKDDHVTLSGFSFELPLSLEIPVGGYTYNAEPITDQSFDEGTRQAIQDTQDFIKTASMYLDYNNETTFGLSLQIDFIADGFETVRKVVEILPDQEGSTDITVDADLLDVITAESGYDIEVALTLPNETDAPYTLAFKDTDKISVGIRLDGIIHVHVPEQ